MTNHFSDAELTCKCGCGMLPDKKFMDRVETLRVKAGFPMGVSSGARCANHNAKVSGTGTDGPHTTGKAIDLAVSRGEAYKVLKIAFEMGFTGIGVNQKGSSRFIHLDDISSDVRPTIWSY